MTTTQEINDMLREKETQWKEWLESRNKAPVHTEPSTTTQKPIVHTQPQPQKFVSTTHYVIQPQKWRPDFDTEGPFSTHTARAGACVPVTYEENGIKRTYKDAYWTPLYPTWVAAASADSARRLEEDGFKVLDAELSHDARCHFGGPQPQCDRFAKFYTPCANMKDNKLMQEKYGRDILINNWNKYTNEKNKDTIETVALQRQIDYGNQYAYAQLTGIFAQTAPSSTKAPKSKGKNTNTSLASITDEINNARAFAFSYERAPSLGGGHTGLANMLAGRSPFGCNF